MGLLGREKHHTKMIGEISESAITTRFLQLGYVVLIPYGGSQRYDLVIEDVEGQFWRVQCKTRRIDKDGAILRFSTSISNVTGKNKQPRNYRGQCDYFAVYNERLNKFYLIPVDHVGINGAGLWLAPPKNNQNKNKLWARDYEL